MTALNPNSRFTLVDTPALLPGNDFVTGTPVGPFIDTHCDVPFEKRGRLYLSLDTVREMAIEAGLFEGLVPEAKVVQAYDKGYADAQKENIRGNLADARARVADALDALDGVLAVDEVSDIAAA